METVEPPGLTCAVVVTSAQVKDESEKRAEKISGDLGGSVNNVINGGPAGFNNRLPRHLDLWSVELK